MPLDRSRVLVTGGSGMIGRVLGNGIAPPSGELDVTNETHVRKWIQTHQPSGVMHLAAIDLARSENDEKYAMAVNAEGARIVAAAAHEAGIPFVFLSSGAIFNGAKDQVHDEDAIPDPTNAYARSKFEGELRVRKAHPGALIVRTGWVFGGSQAYHKKFVDVAIEKAQAGESIRAVDNRSGSPTYVEDFVKAVWKLFDDNARGIIHVVNAGIATPYDIATEIVALIGSSSTVEAVSQEALGDGPIRPLSEALTSQHVALRPWQEALKDYWMKRAR